MEDRIKQSLPKAHHQTETEGKQDRAHRLKEKRTDKKVFRQRPDTAQIDIADRLHEKLSFLRLYPCKVIFTNQKRRSYL